MIDKRDIIRGKKKRREEGKKEYIKESQGNKNKNREARWILNYKIER